jgi:hypothetical protein
MPSSKVIEAIAVTAELCGRTFTPGAASVFAGDLDGLPDEAVLAALTRCRKEVRGALTVQDVVSRLDDGRPGAEEAWAMIPRDEISSIVWTEEMAQAYGAAGPLLAEGDRIAARMAFKEAYAKLVAEARDRREMPRWTPSMGSDASGRQLALIDAVRLRRMRMDHAMELLQNQPEAQQGLLISLGVDKHPLLAAPSQAGREKVRALLSDLRTLTLGGQ